MNFLIINFNTQDLTERLIMSINKFNNGAKIIVFDNSDKEPFINKFKNVMVIDNTNGQYINFDSFINRYPEANRTQGRWNHFASAKHCYTIEWCIQHSKENFILLDSDVLIKKDCSDLLNGVSDDCVYIGCTMKQPGLQIKRVVPYFLYINTQKCKELDIHYFDDKHMHGLTRSGDLYDTGAAFYLQTRNYKFKEINIDDYMVHFAHGSWNCRESKKRIPKDEFFETYKDLWI